MVPFKWHFGNTKLSENQKIMLTVSSDKDFKNVVALEEITSLTKKDLYLPAEKYYWKISITENLQDKSENISTKSIASQNGRFQIIESLKPSLIVPASKATFNYRTRIPSIRFMWGEANQATSYKVEIATNPSMENPIVEQRTNLTSLIISTLEFGNYYWRVTPYYTINNLGFANPSEVKSFSVERKSVLKKPSLYVPLDNGIVNTDEEIGSIAFSWKRESEAESYIVKIANNSDSEGVSALTKSFLYQLANGHSNKFGRYINKILSKNYGNISFSVNNSARFIVSFFGAGLLYAFYKVLGINGTGVMQYFPEWDKCALILKICAPIFLLLSISAALLGLKDTFIAFSHWKMPNKREPEISDVYDTYSIIKEKIVPKKGKQLVFIDDLDRIDKKNLIVEFLKELYRFQDTLDKDKEKIVFIISIKPESHLQNEIKEEKELVTK